MDFAIVDSPEQAAFRKEVSQWLKENVPAGIEHSVDPKDMSYEQYQLRRELGRRLGKMGWLYPTMPKQYGGGDLPADKTVVLYDEISKLGLALPPYYDAGGRMAAPTILVHGSEEHKNRFLPPICRGEVRTWQLLTEPGAGSDLAGIKMTAIRDGDHYVVHGTKNWITTGKEADVCILIAHSDPTERHKGISAFIVEAKSPGYGIGKVEDKLGIKGSSTTSLVFDNVRVPVENRLGAEGEGFKVAMSTLDGGRIGIAAQALGIARAAYQEALQYSRERVAFGKPIGDFGAIQEMLANMATDLDAARLLIWRSAVAKDRKEKYGKLSAMAKLFAAEMAHRVTHDALQIHGGYGYVKEYAAERHCRDARITEIYEGTSEIQRLVIAREVLTEIAAQA
jgi:butyryl-CoA dehydrogenase